MTVVTTNVSIVLEAEWSEEELQEVEELKAPGESREDIMERLTGLVIKEQFDEDALQSLEVGITLD